MELSKKKYYVSTVLLWTACCIITIPLGQKVGLPWSFLVGMLAGSISYHIHARIWDGYEDEKFWKQYRELEKEWS